MFKAEPRKDAPTFTFDYEGGSITAFITSHEWVPWVTVDEVTKYLGVNVPDTLREAAKRDANLAIGKRRDTGEIVANLHFAVRLVIAAQRDELHDPFLQWLYTWVMPGVMRHVSGRPLELLDPPQKTTMMLDGRPEMMMNEAATYYAALMPAAGAGRSFMNQVAYAGGWPDAPKDARPEAKEEGFVAVGVKEHDVQGRVLREYVDANGEGVIDLDDAKAMGIDIEAMYADMPESLRRQIGPLPPMITIDKSKLPPRNRG